MIYSVVYTYLLMYESLVARPITLAGMLPPRSMHQIACLAGRCDRSAYYFSLVEIPSPWTSTFPYCTLAEEELDDSCVAIV